MPVDLKEFAMIVQRLPQPPPVPHVLAGDVALNVFLVMAERGQHGTRAWLEAKLDGLRASVARVQT